MISSGLETPLVNESQIERDWQRQNAHDAQERFRLRVALPDGAVENAPPPVPFQPPARTPIFTPGGVSPDLCWGALLGIAALLAVRRFAPWAGQSNSARLNAAAAGPSKPAELSPQELVEQQAFADFLVTFNAGPTAIRETTLPSEGAPVSQSAAAAKPGVPQKEADPAKNFFACAPKHLLAVRNFLQEIGRGPEESARQKLLESLCGEVSAVKGMAGIPELLSVWKLASCLESLLKQLVAQASKVTPSTLRTVAAASDVLDSLCQPGLDAKLCASIAPRFLAVDDDAISRHAISFALKKAFSQPDVAPSGEAALALASEHAYDAIFLDVLMPGMDGFETCSKIRQTRLNQTTPVVFITWQNDFEARAKSSLSGGNDLIGKPVLTFEVTLKALTLTLRARLQAQNQSAAGPDESTALKPAPCASEKEAVLV